LEKLAPKQTVDRFLELTATDGPEHQLFGHETTIQGTSPPQGYELLMQFDADSILGASFGDGGASTCGTRPLTRSRERWIVGSIGLLLI
jgi:hypothetical protein